MCFIGRLGNILLIKMPLIKTVLLTIGQSELRLELVSVACCLLTEI